MATLEPTARPPRALTVSVLLLLLLAVGCNPLNIIGYFTNAFMDDKHPPQECQIAPLDKKDKDKEVTVVLTASFVKADVPHEILTADSDLCERLAQHLRGYYQLNKEKVTIVPPSRVRTYLNGSLNSGAEDGNLDGYELGKHFKANYVIDLEINELNLYEPRSRQQMLRGNAEVSVTVLDLSKPRGEGRILAKDYRIQYPVNSPIPVDLSNPSPAAFRTLFLERMARDLSRWFAAYPMDEQRSEFGE